jgi:hypothetical protein
LAKYIVLRNRRVNARSCPSLLWLVAVILIIGMLAACGGDDDSDRTFAPETGGKTDLPTNTPNPTNTAPPLDRQPGESSGELAGSDQWFKQAGAAQAITGGIDEVAIVTVGSGKARKLPIARQASVLAVAAPDGSACLVIDRSRSRLSVRRYKADGSLQAEWSPPALATPQASPVTQANVIQTGDEIAWKPDSSGAAIAIVGVGVFVTDADLKMQEVHAGRMNAVTAVAWSPSGQSIALATWNNVQKSSAIVTIGINALDSTGTGIFALPEGDGRYIRSLAWGAEQVGLVFALRAATANFSLPNDLYFLPRFGEPMRLLASAGIAAPAAVVDQVAIAGNGSTVAFSILIPGSIGLRFHSVWVTDALSPSATRANTTGLRRVTEIRWSKDGVLVSGTRRSQKDGAAYQVAVVERLSSSEPIEIAADRSAPTPIASPQASPLAATPETN